MNWIQSHALSLLITILPIGVLASIAYQCVKRFTTVVDSLPTWAHRGAVTVIALLITSIASALHVDVVCQDGVNCLTALDKETLKTLIESGLAALVAFAAHAAKKKVKG